MIYYVIYLCDETLSLVLLLLAPTATGNIAQNLPAGLDWKFEYGLGGLKAGGHRGWVGIQDGYSGPKLGAWG